MYSKAHNKGGIIANMYGYLNMYFNLYFFLYFAYKIAPIINSIRQHHPFF